jgi:hypothetical protein
MQGDWFYCPYHGKKLISSEQKARLKRQKRVEAGVHKRLKMPARFVQNVLTIDGLSTGELQIKALLAYIHEDPEERSYVLKSGYAGPRGDGTVALVFDKRKRTLTRAFPDSKRGSEEWSHFSVEKLKEALERGYLGGTEIHGEDYAYYPPFY